MDDQRKNAGNKDTGEGGNDEFKRVVLRFARAQRTLIMQDTELPPEFVAYAGAKHRELLGLGHGSDAGARRMRS